MAHKLKPSTRMAIVLIVCTGLFSIAWQNKQAHNLQQVQQDTIPKKQQPREDKTVIKGDIDKAIDQVNRAKENLEDQLQNKDWEKMHRNLEESLEKIDPAEIQEHVAKAMKEIDLQKIQLQVQESLKQIDWQKMQSDLEKVHAEIRSIDGPRMQKEIQQALEKTKRAMAEMKDVDMQKIQRELEETREELHRNEGRMKEELEEARNSIRQNLKKDFRKEIEKAREGVHRAEAELRNYREMLLEMDKDGLLKKDGPYKVEYKNGVLTIDGKTQPDTIINKYKHYFKKENVVIKRGSGDDEENERTIEL